MQGDVDATRGRVLVLDRRRLAAEVVAAALCGEAVGVPISQAESWLEACDASFSIVVVDVAAASASIMRLVAARLPGAAIVQLVPAGASVPVASVRTGGIVAGVRRSDGLDALRRQVRALHRWPRTAVRPPTRPLSDATDRLTVREHEVGALMAAGRSNHEIATALGVSVHTVRSHVQRILIKVAAPNRFAAADVLRRTGLIPRQLAAIYDDHRLVEGGVP